MPSSLLEILLCHKRLLIRLLLVVLCPLALVPLVLWAYCLEIRLLLVGDSQELCRLQGQIQVPKVQPRPEERQERPRQPHPQVEAAPSPPQVEEATR